VYPRSPLSAVTSYSNRRSTRFGEIQRGVVKSIWNSVGYLCELWSGGISSLSFFAFVVCVETRCVRRYWPAVMEPGASSGSFAGGVRDIQTPALPSTAPFESYIHEVRNTKQHIPPLATPSGKHHSISKLFLHYFTPYIGHVLYQRMSYMITCPKNVF